MKPASRRITVRLDGEHAAKLSQLAERTLVQEGALARALLSMAIEDLDPDASNIATLLDGIDGAYERTTSGPARAGAGKTIPLAEL